MLSPGVLGLEVPKAEAVGPVAMVENIPKQVEMEVWDTSEKGGSLHAAATNPPHTEDDMCDVSLQDTDNGGLHAMKQTSISHVEPSMTKKRSKHWKGVQQILMKSKQARLEREAEKLRNAQQNTAAQEQTTHTETNEMTQEPLRMEEESASKDDERQDKEEEEQDAPMQEESKEMEKPKQIEPNEDERQEMMKTKEIAPKENAPQEKEETTEIVPKDEEQQDLEEGKENPPKKDESQEGQKPKAVASPQFSNFKEMYERLVTTLPKDFQSTAYITADQQQPPKKRGRKPKDDKKSEPEPASKKPRTCKSKAKESEPSANDSAKPKAKAKSRRGKQSTKEATLNKALDEMAIPREVRKRAKRVALDTATAPASYKPMDPAEDENIHDVAAVESAASDVSKLTPPEGQAPVIEENDAVSLRKKQLSRKSCAYKKARNLALKQGLGREAAAEAGKKVALLNS